jgi:predicted NBD/HSP70 family sugar kinase
VADTPSPGPLAGAVELFTLLRDGVPRSRSELARDTGLSRATVGGRVDALLAAALIAPSGTPESRGGRPSNRFTINADARIVAAVDIGATHVAVALSDLAARILIDHTEQVALSEDPVATMAAVARQLRALLAESGRSTESLLAIGVGLPGPVDHGTGRPVNPPIMPGWNNADVASLLRAHLGVPVLIDNDVNLMALGERTRAWPRVDDLVFVKVATGIGSGLILGGRIHRGARGIAGDIGHAPLATGAGIVCRCGNLDCLEAHAAWPAVIRQLEHDETGDLTGADVLRLVQAGDSDAIQHIRQAGREIGQVLTTVVQLVNPAVIVLGGSMVAAGEHLIAGVREIVYQRSAPLATDGLQIVASSVGNAAGLIGASILAIDYALAPERVTSLLIAD